MVRYLIHKVDAVVIRESLWAGSFVDYEGDYVNVEVLPGFKRVLISSTKVIWGKDVTVGF